MPRLRAAIVGLNHYHVTGWAESLALLPDDVEVVALCDPDPIQRERLAPDHHDVNLPAALPAAYRTLPCYPDLDALLQEQPIDLALVTLPNRDAPAAVERLAQAGVHLLVDKPMARTAAEARRAVAAAEAAGVKLAVGLTRRYSAGWRDAKALIDAGRLGSLLAAEAVFNTSSARVRDPRNMLFQRELMGGGILHWLGIHDLDALLWFSGQRVTEVQAMLGHIGGDAIDVEDAASVSLRFANGALATVHYAYALPRPASDGYLALRGRHGSLKISPAGDLTWLGPGSLSDPVLVKETAYTLAKVPGYGVTGVAIIADLIHAIRSGGEPLASGAALVSALEIVDAAYESAASGQRVRLPEPREGQG